MSDIFDQLANHKQPTDGDAAPTAPVGQPTNPPPNAAPAGGAPPQDIFSKLASQPPPQAEPPASSAQEPEKPGFLSRTYETSGAQGLVGLGKAFIKRPIDLYQEAVDAMRKGDYKTASERAMTLTSYAQEGGLGAILDKNNPLVKAAEAIIMHPVEELRKAGHEATKGTPGDLTGDLLKGAQHAIRAVPVAGQTGDVLSEDIHNNNWSAVAGDVVGTALPFGVAKVAGLAGKAIAGGAKASEAVEAGTAEGAASQVERNAATNSLEQAGNVTQAIGKADTTNAASQMVDTAHQNMHDTFASDIATKVKQPLQGTTIPAEGSPWQKAAQDVMQMPENADAVDKALGNTIPLSTNAKNLVEDISNAFKKPAKAVVGGEEEPLLYDASGKGIPRAAEAAEEEAPVDLDIDKLIKARQMIGARSRDAWGSGAYQDAKAYSKLIDGIDDSIKQLAEETDNPQVVKDYDGIRKEYRSTKELFEDKDARSTIEALRRGNLADVTNELTSGKFAPHKWDILQKIISKESPANVGKLQDGITSNLAADGPDSLLKFSPDKIERVGNIIGQKNMQVLSGSVKDALVADGAGKLFNMAPNTIEKIEGWVGAKGVDELADSGMRELLAKSSPDGTLNPDLMVEEMEQLRSKPGFRRMLPSSAARQKFEAVAEQLQQSSDWKNLVKRFVIGPTVAGSAVATSLTAAHLFPNLVVDTIAGLAPILGFKGMKTFIGDLADSPKLWKYTTAVDKVTGSPAAATVNAGVKATPLAQALQGADGLKGDGAK